MRLENDTQHATIIVTKGNDFFNYTRAITVYRGTRFVNLSVTVESTVEGVSLDWVQTFVNCKGEVIQTIPNRTVALVDEGVKALGQLIFTEEYPTMEIVNNDNPCILSLLYNLQGESKGDIQISVSAYSVSDDPKIYQDATKKADYFNTIVTDNLNSPQEPLSDAALDVFDYKKAVNEWNISYVACRESEIIPKFAKDPSFSLVFINNDVAIFMVKQGSA
jgi:hypothetical protein